MQYRSTLHGQYHRYHGDIPPGETMNVHVQNVLIFAHAKCNLFAI